MVPKTRRLAASVGSEIASHNDVRPVMLAALVLVSITLARLVWLTGLIDVREGATA